ncbi:MAG: alpha/beta hydrolase [Planctomycetaceae bacterium]|nr:alpha/beta hydrolase [Planctomycetaceae bacterium]
MKTFCRVLSVILLLCIPLTAQEPRRLDIDEIVPVPTSGGTWIYGDVLFSHDWHIQKNVLTGNYRLLDGNSMQRSVGTFEECQKRLEEIQTEEGILPMSGSAVILLHGFVSNSVVMKTFAEYMKERKTHDYVYCMTYPSTMQSIFDHAVMLDSVVRNLPPTVKRIDFIGHSMGCIVIRRYMSGPLKKDWQLPENKAGQRVNFSPDKRIGRFMMLGPPNHGSIVAKVAIGKDPVRRRLMGSSGDELGLDWEKTEKSLGIPSCPFAIISGGRGDGIGFSPMIPGDDDGVVSTEGTKLHGAAYWLQFKVGHGEMLLTEEVFDTAIEFLKTGKIKGVR